MSGASLVEWVVCDGTTMVGCDPMSCEPDNVDEDISGPGSLHRIAAAGKLYQVGDRLAASNGSRHSTTGADRPTGDAFDA